MVFINEDLQILVDLGLTVLQAKVYSSLVQTGTAKVKRVSQTSKVSRPDVYRTLSKLQTLGLVEKQIVNPVMFRAIPIEVALEVLLERKKKKYDELKSKSKILVNNLKNNYDVNQSRKESNFVLVPSKEALIKKMKYAIDRTQTSIDVSTSCKRLKYACYCLSGPLKEAWSRNVNGRAIIENPETNHTGVFEKNWSPWAEIRVVSKLPPTIMTMHDNREVFIFIDPDADLRDSPALWSDNPSIIALAEHYFELLWITAVDIKNIQNLT